MVTNITAFCLEWHIKVSNAFTDFLVNPLLPDIQLHLTAWDGANFPLSTQDIKKSQSPYIFCQLLPPQYLLGASPEKLIWVPMLDHIQNKDQEWWNGLPQNLRVIAYSDQIYKKAAAANLRVLKVKYYPNPDNFSNANFQKPITALYWNRRGVFSPELIKKICKTYHIDRLFFLYHSDPQIAKNLCFSLPNKIGKTHVQAYSNMLTPQEYKLLLSQTDIYLAPRISEGVGMTVLEAMASGCAVLSYNAPTMNEYIIHQENGILLDRENVNFVERCYRKASRFTAIPDPYKNERKYLLNKSIQLDSQNKLDIAEIGKSSKESMKIGYDMWKEQLNEMKKFILE